jgi:3-methyladenine DNA glycosylase AlkD
MYLAGLIADEKAMTRQDLQKWVEGAYWYMISDYTVPWIAAESNFGMELALEWIESEEEFIASAGWATLSSLVSIKPDDELNIEILRSLLDRVENEIHSAQNRVRYSMNGFVISTGSYVKALTDKAIRIGENIGKVNVDMGGTACKVPLATQYIQKVIDRGSLGKKRKMARC